jgi:hypothetical protein
MTSRSSAEKADTLRRAASILRARVRLRQSEDSKDALREAAATCEDIAAMLCRGDGNDG